MSWMLKNSLRKGFLIYTNRCSKWKRNSENIRLILIWQYAEDQ